MLQVLFVLTVAAPILLALRLARAARQRQLEAREQHSAARANPSVLLGQVASMVQLTLGVVLALIGGAATFAVPILLVESGAAGDGAYGPQAAMEASGPGVVLLIVGAHLAARGAWARGRLRQSGS
jgi:hypothetical protein